MAVLLHHVTPSRRSSRARVSRQRVPDELRRMPQRGVVSSTRTCVMTVATSRDRCPPRAARSRATAGSCSRSSQPSRRRARRAEAGSTSRARSSLRTSSSPTCGPLPCTTQTFQPSRDEVDDRARGSRACAGTGRRWCERLARRRERVAAERDDRGFSVFPTQRLPRMIRPSESKAAPNARRSPESSAARMRS